MLVYIDVENPWFPLENAAIRAWLEGGVPSHGAGGAVEWGGGCAFPGSGWDFSQGYMGINGNI